MQSALLILFLFLCSVVYGYSPCAKRYVRGDSQPQYMVCVCNATYCDDFPPLGTLNANQAAVYVTSISGKRFQRSTVTWAQSKSPKTKKFVRKDGKLTILKHVGIRPNNRMQKMLGFGGAFTDAAGINIASLNSATQEFLMQSYYGPNGIQFSMGRTPIASCDFSTHEYSYDDVSGDFALQHFALTAEDFQYKIPYIKRALTLTGGDLKLFASPWSAPGWMKTNGHMKGGGTLKGFAGGPYYVTWGQYFIRYLEEYNKNGITFWGLTMQNEPTTGTDPNFGWQTMYFNAQSERDFIRDTLGPALRNSPLGRNIALMTMDDQRNNLPGWADVVFSDPVANAYTDGVAVHWYQDRESSDTLLNATHSKWPAKFLLYTEACIDQGQPVLGDWGRGDDYSHDIVKDINNWVSGWTDWNIALNLRGGPNWVNNVVDAPIIVDASKGEFYKQPMFYILGHFSKFVRPNSVRIGSVMTGNDKLAGVAFLTPTNQRVFVVRNGDTHDYYDLEIDVTDRPGQVLRVTLEPQSIATIVWN